MSQIPCVFGRTLLVRLFAVLLLALHAPPAFDHEKANAGDAPVAKTKRAEGQTLRVAFR